MIRGMQGGRNRQQVRWRRFVLGAAAYAISLALLVIAHGLQLIALGPTLGAAAAMLAVNAAFMAAFRTDFNERFHDPSLTWPQVLAGTAILMFVVYHFDRDRGLAAMTIMLVLSFGAFRFNTRQFMTAAGVALAGYALVINLLMWHKPEVVNVWLEGFQWLTLACVLPCFAVIGGRLSEMRQRLRRTNDELSSALETIQKMATHDTLTALPNRALFNETLVHAIARAARHNGELALFFLDLDRFKVVNDTLGHGVGDRVLQEAARRHAAAVRSSDLVARLGGDEFVLLIEDYRQPSDLSELAAKVLAAFSSSIVVDGQELGVSASIGICTYPADGPDAQTLVSNADIAMYRAKDQGRNRFCFYSADLNTLSQERLSLEAGLRHALARGELDIFYQPKIDFASGQA